MNSGFRISIIGAGAAGCFCAINLKRSFPDADITIFESGHAPLAKVAITGGGRCNLTNSFKSVERLSEVYPRGERLMKRALAEFSAEDCCKWFRKEGVRLVTQEDECVFPESQDAMQIVRTLINALRAAGVNVECSRKVLSIDSGEQITLADGTKVISDAIVLTTGGASQAFLDSMLGSLPGIETVSPVPSLFTFKIPDDGIRSLMGTVVKNVRLAIAGTQFRSSGTLLLTDWGVSGPATLKLSSYAARYLSEAQYNAELVINWWGESEQSINEIISGFQASNAKKTVGATHPAEFTSRLWKHLLERAGVKSESRWGELGKKSLARLSGILSSDSYPIRGRARFKEEFVTCGGVSLNSVNINTLECRNIPGLYFAGEVLDVDAVTGGFNLQAAWSTGYVAAKNILAKYGKK